MTLNNISTTALLIILLTAAVIDMRSHRLPNSLTVSAALIGLSLQYEIQGWHGVLDGLTGFGTGFVLFLPFYALRWMGAGDVKLMAAVGIFLGWPLSLLAIGLCMGAGTLTAFYLLAVRGGLYDYLCRYGSMAKYLFVTGSFSYLPPTPGDASTQLFPFALAIFLGTLATLGYGGRLNPLIDFLASVAHV